MRERREIKNGEPPIPQAYLGTVFGMKHDGAGVVRPAMRQRMRTTFQEPVGDASILRDDSENSTHRTSKWVSGTSIKHYETAEMAEL